MKVTVIGAGKMGLPLAAVFASRGATVIAADADSNMVATINRGQAPFDEPGLSELVREMVGANRLSASQACDGPSSTCSHQFGPGC